MISSGFPNWIQVWLLPLAGLALALLTAWYAVRRRWGQVLPWLSSYVLFTAVSNLILLGFVYSQIYAGNQSVLQSSTYCNAYAILACIGPLLVIALLFDVWGYMLRQRPDVHAYGRTIWIGICSILVAFEMGALLFDHTSSWNSNLYRLTNYLFNAGTLVICGVSLSLLISKTRLSIRLQPAMLLIGSLMAVWHVLDFSTMMAGRRYGSTQMIENFMQVAQIVVNVIFLLAVRAGTGEAALSLSRSEMRE